MAFEKNKKMWDIFNKKNVKSINEICVKIKYIKFTFGRRKLHKKV